MQELNIRDLHNVSTMLIVSVVVDVGDIVVVVVVSTSSESGLYLCLSRLVDCHGNRWQLNFRSVVAIECARSSLSKMETSIIESNTTMMFYSQLRKHDDPFIYFLPKIDKSIISWFCQSYQHQHLIPANMVNLSKVCFS